MAHDDAPPPTGNRRSALQRRRELLIGRSALLRWQIAEDAQALRTPLAVADQVRSGWRWAREHAQWIAGGAALVAALRPRRSVRLVMRAFWAWNAWRRAHRLLRPFIDAGLAAHRSGRRPG